MLKVKQLLVPMTIAASLLSTITLPAQQSSLPALQSPSRVLTFSSLRHQNGRRYSNGHFVKVTKQMITSGNANVSLMAGDGTYEDSLIFTPQQDAAKVELVFGVADRPSHVLVTGRAIKNTGLITQFISGQNTDGSHPQILHTGSFLAIQACEAADGTLWAVGRDMHSEAHTTYPLLRHYSFKGQKLGTYVTNSALAIPNLPIFGKPLSQVHLACAGNDVTLYDGLNQKVTRFSHATGRATTFSVALGATTGMEATGFGVDSSGRLFASWRDVASGTTPARPLVAVLVLPVETGLAQWNPLSLAPLASFQTPSLRLLSVENNALVLMHSQPGDDQVSVLWSSLESPINAH